MLPVMKFAHRVKLLIIKVVHGVLICPKTNFTEVIKWNVDITFIWKALSCPMILAGRMMGQSQDGDLYCDPNLGTDPQLSRKKASTTVTLLTSPSNPNVTNHHVGFVEGGAMTLSSSFVGCFNVRSPADVPSLWLSFLEFNESRLSFVRCRVGCFSPRSVSGE